MSKIAIVTDSTADLSLKLIEDYNITIVPLKVLINNEVYRDGIDITSKEFYQKLEMTEKLPTTSQPSPGDFVEVYKKLAEEYTSIISIHLSSQLSGTYQSAMLAKGMLSEIDITVIDSKQATMGLGLIIIEVARYAKDGKSKEEIIYRVHELINKIKIYFAVDTLEYLEKGGRIGKAQAFLGTMLNIKPILALSDGIVIAKEKVRGKNKALNKLIDLTKQSISQSGKAKCVIVHGNDMENAIKLHQSILNEIECSEIFISDIGPVIGTHVGPGTIGIIFYSE